MREREREWEIVGERREERREGRIIRDRNERPDRPGEVVVLVQVTLPHASGRHEAACLRNAAGMLQKCSRNAAGRSS